MFDNELWELYELFPDAGNNSDVIKLCPYKLFVFAVIMANASVGFPVPKCKRG